MGTIRTDFEFGGISKGQKGIDSLTGSIDIFLNKADLASKKLGSNPFNLGNSLKKSKLEVDDLTGSLDKFFGKVDAVSQKLGSNPFDLGNSLKKSILEADELTTSLTKLSQTPNFTTTTANIGKLTNSAKELNGSLNSKSKPKLGSLFDDFEATDKRLKNIRDVTAEITKNSEYKGSGLKWLRDGSISTKKEILSLRGQITNLEKLASATGATETTIFNKYSNQAKLLNKELVGAENKLKYLNSVDKNQRTIGKQPSKLASGVASYASRELLMESGIPMELAMAFEDKLTGSLTTGLTKLGTAVAGVSAGAVVAAGSLAIAGTALVAYSYAAKNAAERDLKIQERAAVTYGKAFAATGVNERKLQNANFDNQINNAQIDRLNSSYMDDLLRNGSNKAIEERRNYLRFMRDNSSNEDIRKRSQNDLLQLETFPEKRNALQNAEMWQRWENSDKRREAEKLEQKILQKEREDREERAAKRLKDSGKLLGDTFTDLSSKFYAENPIALAMIDGMKSTDQLKESLKGLPPELQKIGQSALEMQKKLNTQNINKAIAENRMQALTYDQKARQLGMMSERQFTPFQDRLSAVERTAAFTSNSMDLMRRQQESSYYAFGYNPNNPRDFNKLNPLAEHQLSTINQLQMLGVGNTGVYGRGLIADQVLKNIPGQDELLNMLNSSNLGIRNNASKLLGYQSNALLDKQSYEQQKFKDSFDEMRANELNRKFANEHLLLNQQNFNSGLINKDKFNQNRLGIYESLGNNLSPDMVGGKMDSYIGARDATNRREERMATELSELKGLVATIVLATENGFKLSPDMKQSLENAVKNVNITVNREDGTPVNPAPSRNDTATHYSLGLTKTGKGLTNY